MPPRPLAPALAPALLAAAAAAPALPAAPGAAAVALVLVASWALRRRLGRSAAPVVAALAAAAALSAAPAVWKLAPARSEAAWRAAAQEEYERLWTTLEATAARAVAPPPTDAVARLAAFDRLRRIAQADPDRPLTLLLLDPDGEARAWAGPGLLHELAAGELPLAGTAYRAGHTAATLLAVAPIAGGRRPWRVVAGASLPTDELPFADLAAGARRWTLAAEGGGPAPAGFVSLRREGSPRMVVELASWLREPAGRREPPPLLAAAGPLTWLVLGLGFLAVLARRLAGDRAAANWRSLDAAGAGACWSLAAGLHAPEGLAVALALVLAGRGPRSPVAPGRPWGTVRALRAAAGAALLVLAAAWGLAASGDQHLATATRLQVPAPVFLLRLAFLAGGWGLLVRLAGAGAGRPARQERWIWLAFALVGVAAAGHDRPLVSAALLVAGLAAAGPWLARADVRRPAVLAVAGLLAALAAASAWEAAARERLRARLPEEVLARLAPPSAAEAAALERELTAHFAALPAVAPVPAPAAMLDPADLAYRLWKGSPLTRHGALSALVVLDADGLVSSFSFGLPLEGWVLPASPQPAGDLDLPGWSHALLTGEAPLDLGGREATIGWRMLLRPGYRLAPDPGGKGFAPELLRGAPPARRPSGARLGELGYALYAADGRSVVSPWRDAPALPALLRERPAARVGTPGGVVWAVRRLDRDGVEVLFLPVLGAAQGLERVGYHALASLLAAAVLGGLGLLLAVPAARLCNALGRTLRSYSTRLVLVYTVLLVAPLLAVNTLVLRVLGDRLVSEQRRVGEAALEAAQQVLGEYVLSLDPGFGIGTELNDRLLVWLAGVVDHELNLYWGSSLYASSKRELFTAGLLPTRIPGEVYSRIVLLGQERSSRVNRVGDVSYLEVYAPLRVGGAAQESLFLSMPLLAQQEEVAAEIASLRGKTILATSALFAILLAVAARLTEGFTRPLRELVEGTRRIAAGDRALGLTPTAVELEALVRAIDRMAASIAQGRERLLREKQVVERVVENVTSGVLSLDSTGRVLLRNRAAGELLGAEVGEELATALERRGHLRPILAALAAGSAPGRARTVRIVPAEGAEREWTVLRVPLPAGGEPAALVVVEDVTEVLRGQRLQAWAEMARIIAHEIKNPLTPIKLSAEHMREVYVADREHFDDVFESCTANILRQVEELRQISAEFSTYSHIPRFEPRPGDLARALARLVDSYRLAPARGVAVRFHSERRSLMARFDERLLGRAVRNLLENALRAVAGGGEVEVGIAVADSRAVVTVADTGPGVPPAQLARIFDPYFSTHAGGTGLGLPITRRIAEEHGGSIHARNRPHGGLEVTILLPLEGDPGPAEG